MQSSVLFCLEVMFGEQRRAFSWVRGMGGASWVSSRYVHGTASKRARQGSEETCFWAFASIPLAAEPSRHLIRDLLAFSQVPVFLCYWCLQEMLLSGVELKRSRRKLLSLGAVQKGAQDPPQSWSEGDHCPLWSPAALTDSSLWSVKAVAMFCTLTPLSGSPQRCAKGAA